MIFCSASKSRNTHNFKALRASLVSILVALSLSSCASPPTIHTYSFPLALSEGPAQALRLAVVVDPFTGDAPYTSTPMVYRTSPYRLDVYTYHRWIAPPSLLLSDAIQSRLLKSKRLHTVPPGTHITGRVVACDQVEYDGPWKAHVGVRFTFRDASGAVAQVTLHEVAPMQDHQPESFARAVSEATDALADRLLTFLSDPSPPPSSSTSPNSAAATNSPATDASTTNAPASNTAALDTPIAYGSELGQ